MLRWLILSTLFVTNVLASLLSQELEDNDLWRRGRPSSVTTPTVYDSECVKDILILWDNSQSVGISSFQNSVVPFLKKLVNSAKLNVGTEGTHIGIITFSSEENTKTLLKIGEKTTPEELTSFLDSLDYDELMGERTYTGKAFQIANSTFNLASPLNHRPAIADVILLFTDGEPRARTHKQVAEQQNLADACSASLKTDKDVKIIGLAIGTEKVLARFRPYVKMWSSEGSLFTADVRELDNVLDQLVADTCKPAGDCGCDEIILDTTYTKTGGMVAVDWLQPTFTCTKNKPSYDVTITPKGTKPGITLFGKGKHTVTYRFTYSDAGRTRTLDCPVSITVAECGCESEQNTIEGVIGPNENTGLVQWNVPAPSCEARLIRPQLGGATVDMRRFGRGQHRVQYVYEHRNRGNTFQLTCDVNIRMEDCKCPVQRETVEGVIGPRQTTGVAKWKIPVPSCSAKLIKPRIFGTAPVFDTKRFREGDHREEYVYQHANGLQFTCGVNIKMTACRCPPTQTIGGKVTPGNRRGYVSWVKPMPQPCAVTEDRRNPRSTRGSFSVGQHKLTYRYTYAKNSLHSFDLECQVNIIIKGEFCGRTTYDPATYVCCCGKIHKKTAGYKCCGLEYYNTNMEQCCNPERAVLVLSEEQCP